MNPDYQPTVDDLRKLEKRIPDKYIPGHLKGDEFEAERLFWLDNRVYLMKETGTPWEDIDGLEQEELLIALFPV